MIRWLWAKKYGPIRLFVLLFGKDLADPPTELEKARYRMVIMPKSGPDRKTLVKTGKKLFDVDDETINEALSVWTANKNGEVGIFPWEIKRMFTREDLQYHEVIQLRNAVKKWGHYSIKYDELARIEDMANEGAKVELLKKRTDDLIREEDPDYEYSYSGDMDGDLIHAQINYH